MSLGDSFNSCTGLFDRIFVVCITPLWPWKVRSDLVSVRALVMVISHNAASVSASTQLLFKASNRCFTTFVSWMTRTTLTAHRSNVKTTHAGNCSPPLSSIVVHLSTCAQAHPYARTSTAMHTRMHTHTHADAHSFSHTQLEVKFGQCVLETERKLSLSPPYLNLIRCFCLPVSRKWFWPPPRPCYLCSFKGREKGSLMHWCALILSLFPPCQIPWRACTLTGVQCSAVQRSACDRIARKIWVVMSWMSQAEPSRRWVGLA